jgi:hypothetical protein
MVWMKDAELCRGYHKCDRSFTIVADRHRSLQEFALDRVRLEFVSRSWATYSNALRYPYNCPNIRKALEYPRNRPEVVFRHHTPYTTLLLPLRNPTSGQSPLYSGTMLAFVALLTSAALFESSRLKGALHASDVTPPLFTTPSPFTASVHFALHHLSFRPFSPSTSAPITAAIRLAALRQSFHRSSPLKPPVVQPKVKWPHSRPFTLKATSRTSRTPMNTARRLFMRIIERSGYASALRC